MSKHTPGPWHWHDAGDHSQLVNVEAKPGEYVPDYIIDDGSRGGEYCGFDVDCPNARLIAAAPRMYEVLRMVVSDGVYDEHDAAFVEAHEILAELGGEE